MLSRLLSPRRIVIWDQPVRKEMVLRTLAEAIGKDDGIDDVDALFKSIMKREEQGSTFFNEGVAFPHVQFHGLTNPVVAIGLTKQGVSDVFTEKLIELVFLILSPAETPDTQVQVLGLASRAGQNRHLLQGLTSVRTPQEAMKVIFDWEASNESSPSKLS
jgi:mannitol/fructose-specific phosphotransferase system IIA component (Ntr-type)